MTTTTVPSTQSESSISTTTAPSALLIFPTFVILSLSPTPPSHPPREILLLSPSPLRKSKTRLADRLVDAVEEPVVVEPVGSRRKCKNRNGSMGFFVCGSPMNGRRSRRRLEPDVQEERDLGVVKRGGIARERVPKLEPRTRRMTY
ncbi:hypothetical protein Vadar_032199 [Vaccinium darrowii]|uniref:Uncharacterized protein n=1 Tax=Vaccinium darrowii TaxID=229202 RepID=A0ACB7Z122_9ERIC|nr:hypothetical protein Vadar_032199 [Vaccinium darrowii]